MDSRLRKLLSTRRSRAFPKADEGATDEVRHSPSVASGRFPMFLGHAFGRSSAPSRKKPEPPPLLDLPSLSYDATVPGKAPTRGDRPEPGNGPVRLQASRRLSSGELLVTEQDYARTLDDIRQGEYIVGGKQERQSQTRSQLMNPPVQFKFISSAPSSPREQTTFSSALPPLPDSSLDLALSPIYESRLWNQTSPPRPPSSPSSLAPYLPGSTLRVDSGTNQAPLGQFRGVTSSTSLPDTIGALSPTVQAIYKAESNRLASLYASADVGRWPPDEARHSRGHEVALRSHQSSRLGHPASPASMSSPQLPAVPRDSPGRGLGLRGVNSTMNIETSPLDDHSDGSSNQRVSVLSSCETTSSATTHTSATEEFQATREDVRKLVDDMRTTYLNAIEASTPPLGPLPDIPSTGRKPRTKKSRFSGASAHSLEGGRRASRRRSGDHTPSRRSTSTASTGARLSTSSPLSKSNSKRTSSSSARRVSQPVACIATLPAIQSSPPPAVGERNPEMRLHRADSTTLGSMEKYLRIVPAPERKSKSPSGPESVPSGQPPNSEDSNANRRPDVPQEDNSVPSTPEKLKASKKPSVSESIPLWQIEADRLFADADLGNFESLCDNMFNNTSLGEGKVDALESWTVKSAPPKPEQTSSLPPAGLALTGVQLPTR